jgi:hypothetical protein
MIRSSTGGRPSLRLMPTKGMPHPSAFIAEGGTRNLQPAAGSTLTMAMKAGGPGCEAAALRNRATAVDFIRQKARHTPLERLAGGKPGTSPNFRPETYSSSAILRR